MEVVVARKLKDEKRDSKQPPTPTPRERKRKKQPKVMLPRTHIAK